MKISKFMPFSSTITTHLFTRLPPMIYSFQAEMSQQWRIPGEHQTRPSRSYYLICKSCAMSGARGTRGTRRTPGGNDASPTQHSPSPRGRSKSESDSRIVVNSTFQKTPSNRSLLESSLLKKAVLSPMNGLSPGGLSPLASSLSESEGNVSDDSNTSSKKKTVKSKCPCNATSGGKAWYLTCKNCGQAWHNLCANLRGSELTQRVIDSILPHWKCPWCYVSPYPRPKNHKSVKLANSLQSTSCANQISSQVSK